MNLSCRPFCQSSSESVSRTPPGAEPALLTNTSMRPKCLCALSTNFLGGFLQHILAARAHRHIAALARQRRSDALADAFAAAGDARDLALQLQVHRLPPRLADAILRELPAASRLVNT